VAIGYQRVALGEPTGGTLLTASGVAADAELDLPPCQVFDE
jgi:hypothetical protein